MDAADRTAAPHIAPLLAPELAPLFRRPSLVGVESAWTEHVPFALWIVPALRPRLLVELGTHNGVSYAAFCEAVLAGGLDTRCYAVDTWEGDAHAGFYGEQVYAALRQFHDRRFGAFSELLRCTFGDARGYIANGSVDLLHIDGCHGYDAVRHDFDSWLVKLSPRAVVLFHDTNVRERGFGVWRLFAELRQRYPAFEFLHGHGLGVLAVGAEVPPPIADLCAVRDPAGIATLRDRFSLIGERWRLEQGEARRAGHMAAIGAARDAAVAALAAESKLRARAAARAGEARAAAADAYEALERLRPLQREVLAGRAAMREAAQLRRDLAASRSARDQAAARLAHLTAERAQLADSLVWQAAAPLRRFERAVPVGLRRRARAALRLAAWTVTLRLRRQLRRRAETLRHLQLLAASDLFDAGWYTARFADVAASGMDPALHYLRHGGPERRPPGPRFDPARYLADYPDIAAAGIDPLLHYLTTGAAEGRVCHELPDAATPAAAGASEAARRIVFLSGEPDTPGHVYRVQRLARAAEAAGAVTSWLRVAEIGARRDEIVGADILFVWRVPLGDALHAAMAASRQGGGAIVYDLDDLMVEPDLAHPALLDALRTEGISTDDARGHYTRVRDAMTAADFCTATTDELAWHMRRHGQPVLVIPNGFDEATRQNSRRARRAWQPDGLRRLGYAGGTRTHQRDFALIAGAVARVLRARPDCRLVLFRSHLDGLPVLDPAEYPALADLGGQIEWRQTVPHARLPEEMARFDVNLAPLEVGNPFCEAKSELKYFEAALVDCPTVASPTGPFRRAIADGRTGCLAGSEDAWHDALAALLDDAALRRRIGRAAYLDVLWRFGPERRREMAASLLDQVLGGPAGARAFALDVQLSLQPPPPPALPEHTTRFAADAGGSAEVTVIVPLYNYARYVTTALDSVAAQTLTPLDLIVVDDASTDDSAAIAEAWLRGHAARFNRVVLLRNVANAGLGATRNAAFGAAETPYVLPLDADDRLLAECCSSLLAEAKASGAAFVYPIIRETGEASGLVGGLPYVPARLVGVPYVHAMTLVSVAAWAAVGGYSDTRLGWEDYDFWCRIAERGLSGRQMPGAPLAEYRVHSDSMLLSVTEHKSNKPTVLADMKQRHPWLSLVEARTPPRVTEAG